MGAMIEINLGEVNQLAKKLNSYALTSGQKESLLNSLGLEVEEQTKDRFDEERDPEGVKWKSLTEAYAIRKRNGWRKRDGTRVSGSSGGILEREGDLRGAIAHYLESGATVVIGSPMEYADYHQNAKKENRRRRFLGLNSGNIADLDKAIDVFMQGQMNG